MLGISLDYLKVQFYQFLTNSRFKIYSDVKDIHDVLELTVYDEDKDHKYEFLGRVKVPLLRIRNDERRWVKFKDKKLRGPAKGDNPQILIECFFVYNKVQICFLWKNNFSSKQVVYKKSYDNCFFFVSKQPFCMVSVKKTH